MALYYFDFRDADGVTRDESGEELPDENHARDAALVCLGEVARDVTLHGYEGHIAIEVREDSEREPIFVALAMIKVVPKRGVGKS
jgi:hypothetical protein